MCEDSELESSLCSDEPSLVPCSLSYLPLVSNQWGLHGCHFHPCQLTTQFLIHWGNVNTPQLVLVEPLLVGFIGCQSLLDSTPFSCPTHFL